MSTRMRIAVGLISSVAVIGCFNGAEDAVTSTTGDPLAGAIDPIGCVPDAGAQLSLTGAQVELIGACNVPLELAVGSQVPSISGTVRDNAGLADGNAVTMMLVSYVGAAAAVIDSVTSVGDGTTQHLVLDPAHTVVAGELLRLRFYTWATGHSVTRPSSIGAVCVGCATPTTTDLPIVSPRFYHNNTSGIPDAPPAGTTLTGGSLPDASNAFVSYLALPSGTVVQALRARVQEGANNGATRALVTLYRIDAGTLQWSVVASSNMSIGNGTVQTISANTLHAIRADSSYAAVVSYGLGSAPINIYRVFVEHR